MRHHLDFCTSIQQWFIIIIIIVIIITMGEMSNSYNMQKMILEKYIWSMSLITSSSNTDLVYISFGCVV